MENGNCKKDRYLSGIQPSGELHLGNYFGAIRQHIQHQYEGNSFYFIANYHALTTVSSPKELEKATFDAVVSYLALGLDPNRSVIFKQSDVPEVLELMWLLLNVTPMSLLEKAVSYKDKVARGISPHAGLFTYPVLMAADILAYNSDIVPVGQDQIQHIEMTRDIAGFFNQKFGLVFHLPSPLLSEASYIPGTDGEKMSKSYGNTIPIFSNSNELKKIIGRIVTDSKSKEAPKDPKTCNVFALYKLFASNEELIEMEQRYLSGGYGYGDAKKALIVKIEEYFADARRRREDFNTRPDDVHDILNNGALRARKVASEVVARARKACGIHI